MLVEQQTAPIRLTFFYFIVKYLVLMLALQLYVEFSVWVKVVKITVRATFKLKGNDREYLVMPCFEAAIASIWQLRTRCEVVSIWWK